MPRVVKKTKSARGKTYNCGRCGKPIVAGEDFYSWAFRYGGKRFQHVACGYPRGSQLTQSRMGDVYAELESAQDLVDSDPAGWTKEDAVAALEQARDVAQEIADEARATADEHFGGGGPHAERADELETIVEAFDDAISSVEDIEEPEDPEDEHDVELVTHEDGSETVRCTVCDVQISGTPDELSWSVVRAEFEQEHAAPDDDPDDASDPWFEQVRAIVSGISI